MRTRSRTIGAIIVALVIAACAAHPKPYVTAGKVTLAVSTILQNASAAADAAYEARETTGFSGRDLNRTRAALLPVAQATQAAETVLIAWPLDADTPPPEMSRLVDAIGQGIRELSEALPSGPTKTAILGYLDSALAVARAVLELFSPVEVLP